MKYVKVTKYPYIKYIGTEQSADEVYDFLKKHIEYEFDFSLKNDDYHKPNTIVLSFEFDNFEKYKVRTQFTIEPDDILSIFYDLEYGKTKPKVYKGEILSVDRAKKEIISYEYFKAHQLKRGNLEDVYELIRFIDKHNLIKEKISNFKISYNVKNVIQIDSVLIDINNEIFHIKPNEFIIFNETTEKFSVKTISHINDSNPYTKVTQIK